MSDDLVLHWLGAQGDDWWRDCLIEEMHLRSYRCLPETCKLCDQGEPLLVIKVGRRPYLVHQGDLEGCDLEGPAYITFEAYYANYPADEPLCPHCGCDGPLYFHEHDDWSEPDHFCNPEDDDSAYFVFSDGTILPDHEAMVRLGCPERQVNPAKES
jgi:hypothetical protein